MPRLATPSKPPPSAIGARTATYSASWGRWGAEYVAVRHQIGRGWRRPSLAGHGQASP